MIDTHASGDASLTSRPLEGVRAVVLGDLPAGTIAGSLLSDLGAEVIRVSSPTESNPLTARPPVVGEASLAWSIIARSSKNATCNFKDPDSVHFLRQLLLHVDIVIESFGPRVLEGHGFDPSDLAASAVVVRISAYGQDGPYRDYPGDDLTALAFSGVAHLTGHRGGVPVALAAAVADHFCAVASTQAAIAALIGRHDSGRGEIIDAPLYGAALRITEWAIPAADRLGIMRTREGNFPSNSAPLGVYASSDDQFVAIVGGSDANFRRLVDAMGGTSIDDPRFATPKQRSELADEVNDLVRSWTASLSIEEIEARCFASGVPFGRVYTASDLSSDPHFLARGDLATVNDPVVGDVVQPSQYPRFVGATIVPPVAPSALGADNEYVWCEIAGLSSDDLQQIQSGGH
jgi:formyl-CoA transferase